MMQILDKKAEESIPPLFRLAFRPMFLFGALFSSLALLLWGGALSGKVTFSPYGNLLFWHSHEMLFGFVAAIIVGFLLTAVQNWTSIPSIRGAKLITLFVLWLAARILMLFDGAPYWLVLPIDLLFLPLAGYWLAKPIIFIGQTRNLFFVPILILLGAANLLMHLGLVLEMPILYQHGYLGAIWLITLLMTVMGGRVIPFFTANGTRTEKVTPIKWLEMATIGSTVMMFLLFLTGAIYYLEGKLIGVLLWLCAGFHLVRVARWRFSVTLSVPLLWSLHLAYWFIPVGLLLMGFSYFFNTISLSSAFHALTVGAMGNMILSMMARVSLGHTGRTLEVKWLVVVAMVVICIAALLRVFGQLFVPQFTQSFIWISAVAWFIAYGLFSIVYFPVLTKARVDGRPG